MTFSKLFNWFSGRKDAAGANVSSGVPKPFSVVISTPLFIEDETRVAVELLDAGLTRFHLRKPDWAVEDLREWVRAFPTEYRKRLVVHAQPDLVCEFQLGGLHLRGGQRRNNNRLPAEIPVSNSCHSFSDLCACALNSAYATIGPIFPSVSKQGYSPRRTPEEYAIIVAEWRACENACPLLALGGLTAANIASTRLMGFDGFAVVGSVWDAADPVAAFRNLIAAWRAAPKADNSRS
ncbi:MAG: thiamine phosphate synthase [Puniceicoccales bacterium]|jgi:thiamine-phosphate pyrophosphorylase|nr:thiamine phosphate synthase [Puniceicoccales bacterium]